MVRGAFLYEFGICILCLIEQIAGVARCVACRLFRERAVAGILERIEGSVPLGRFRPFPDGIG